jgi:4-amino-4-deoxy-L-arabinose transferase-like glycosyltransferase
MIPCRSVMAPMSPTINASLDERWWRLCAASVLLVALGLRVYHLGVEELWLDEAASLHWATAANWLELAVLNNTPPLYYFGLRIWTGLAGQSQEALRLPSAVCGTLFVAVVMWTGRRMFTPSVGLWSALWAALNPVHIYYSQEARAYALLVLALILTYATLWRAVQENAWRRWALFSVCAVIALYSHYLAILGLFPTPFLLLETPDRRRWARYAASMFFSLALFFPWIVASFLLTPHSLQGTEWVKDLWQRTPPALAIPRSLEVFALGSQAGLLPLVLKQSVMSFPSVLRLAGLTVAILLGLWVAVPWGDARLEVPRLGRRKAALWALLLGPLMLLWVVSFWKPLYVAGRYDLVAFPAFPLVLGLAFAKLQCACVGRRWLLAAAALGLLVPVGIKLALYYAPSKRDAHPTAAATAQALHALAANGDVVVFTDLRGLPVLYQLNRLGYQWHDGYCQSDVRRFACRLFPRETEASPAIYDPQRVLSDPHAAAEDVREILSALLPAGSVHVVFGNYAVAHGQLAVARVESLFITELRRAGFEAVAADVGLGIIHYRRETPAKIS